METVKFVRDDLSATTDSVVSHETTVKCPICQRKKYLYWVLDGISYRRDFICDCEMKKPPPKQGLEG